MNRTAWPSLLLGVPLVFATSAFAEKENPYQTIWDRNAFNLKPPTPPPVLEAPRPQSPASNIKLTGITSLFESKRVLLMVQLGTSVEYLSLSEGERQGALEVLSIDEAEGKVKIRNAGAEALLTFETHGNKAVAAPMQPVPGQPYPPAGVPMPVTAGGGPQPQPVFNAQPGGAVPASGGGAIPAPGVAPASSSPAEMRQIPTRILRLPPSAPQSQTIIHTDKPVSLEAATILKGANDLVNQTAIQKGDYPPPFPLE